MEKENEPFMDDPSEELLGDKGKERGKINLTDLNFSTPEGFDQEGTKQVSANVAALETLIPQEILNWIKGEAEQPHEIRKLGDDIAAKLNWYIVYVVLAQYSRIPNLFNFLQKAEAHIYDSELEFKEGENINIKDLQVKYAKAADETNNILEFARKFTLQNKDILAGSDLSPEDKMLLDRIRQLKPSQVSTVLEKINEVLLDDREGKGE